MDQMTRRDDITGRIIDAPERIVRLSGQLTASDSAGNEVWRRTWENFDVDGTQSLDWTRYWQQAGQEIAKALRRNGACAVGKEHE